MTNKKALSAAFAAFSLFLGASVVSLAATAEENYKFYCAQCHGLEGRGDGPNATENVRDMAIKAISLTSAEVDDRQLAEFYILPLYSDEVAAGVPREVRDTEIEGPAIIHRAWCPHPRETDYVRVHSSGNSMEPTIPAGAIVTIDRAENEPERLVGKAVAISLREGGVTLKRLQRTARGGFVGVPDNPTHENRAIHLDDGDRIIGLVQTVHARIG